MYSNTRFHQILEALPHSFLRASKEQRSSDRYSKTFSTYDHLVALIYAQLSAVKSLRELESSFNNHTEKHYHLGCSSIKRSTLSDANSRRDPGIFKEVVALLMAGVHRTQRRRLKEFIYLLDSTPIQLKEAGFEWAKECATKRTTGLKAHLAINSPSDNPVYLNITSANVNDITDAQSMPLQPKTTYIFDKGYDSYSWWYKIHKAQSHFVTRFKSNAAVRVLEIKEHDANEILSDEIVKFKYKKNRAKHENPYFDTPLRRVKIQREGKSPLILATNIMDKSADEIGQLYKQRWQVELFFKWLKQNLKIKRFIGRSKNAVLLQIYAAITTYLLLWIYKSRQGIQSSLHLMLVALRPQLFMRLDTDYHIDRRRKRREIADSIKEKQHVLAF